MTAGLRGLFQKAGFDRADAFAHYISYGTPDRVKAFASDRTTECRDRGLHAAGLYSKRLQVLLERPGTDREVTLVLGASLVRDRFFAQAKQNRSPVAAVHALHLIRSTMSAVVGMGGRLRILCG